MKAQIAHNSSFTSSQAKTVVVPVTSFTRLVELAVAASFTTVAAVSGVTITLAASVDGGNTYSTVPNFSEKIASVANSTQQLTVALNLDYRLLNFAGTPTHLKFTLTNLDATNAVAIVALSEIN